MRRTAAAGQNLHTSVQQVHVSLASYLHAATRYPSSALHLLWGQGTTWLSRCGPEADPLLRICTGLAVQASHGGYPTRPSSTTSHRKNHVLLPGDSNTPDLSLLAYQTNFIVLPGHLGPHYRAG